VRVGTLQAVVANATGPLCFDLVLRLPGGELVTNSYEATIAAP
jgi:hypothetical protein